MTFAFMLLSFDVFSQNSGTESRIFQRSISFRFDSAVFDENYRGNAEALSALDSALAAIPAEQIDKIQVVSVSSPEGSYTYNVQLSKRRCESAAQYFGKRYPEFRDRMAFEWKDEAWDELRILVINDKSLTGPPRDAILKVLDADVSVDTRKWRMSRLPSYNYLLKNLYPQIRSSVVCLVSYHPADSVSDDAQRNQASADTTGLFSCAHAYTHDAPADTSAAVPVQPADSTAAVLAQPAELQLVDSTAVAPGQPAEPQPADTTAAAPVQPVGQSMTIDQAEQAAAHASKASTPLHLLCPPFALKTNLLFDAALAFNAELEVPIGPHVSLAAEWTAPWWLDRENKWCYEANVGNIEARWWWGDRSVRPMFSGWFTSIYADTGKYDFQNSEKGRQGVFWNIGAGGGYAWTLGRSWGLEAMVGLGFFDTRYETYVPREDYSILAYRQTLNTSMFGPTRAKVSVFYKFGQRWYDRKYRHGDE